MALNAMRVDFDVSLRPLPNLSQTFTLQIEAHLGGQGVP